MTLRSLICILGIVASTSAALNAQAGATSDRCMRRETCTRPPSELFRLICNNVSTRRQDTEESRFLYRYEHTLWEMAGADSIADSAAIAKQKIQILWDLYHDDFVCDTAGLKDGNILAYAVHNDFHHFFLDMAGYGLSFNYPDRRDGRTVLDYANDCLTWLKRSSIQNEAQLHEAQVLIDIIVHAGGKPSRPGRVSDPARCG